MTSVSTNSNRAVIFADGASKGNPGPGGWGAIVSIAGSVHELGSREEHTTNNRMELMAAIQALRAAAPKKPTQVIVYTDSSYVINGISKWVHGWQKNGWLTKEKKEVLNRDLWQQLIDAVLACGVEVDWQYVGGHVGVAGNERVDVIASDFAEGKQVALYAGSASTYGIDLMNLGVDDVKKKTRVSSGKHSKAKAYSYVSLVDGQIMVHRTWGECLARVNGKRARFKKALSKEDEQSIIAAFSKGH